MLPLSSPETEEARQSQLQAGRKAELAKARAELEQRDVERWQLLFAANHNRAGGSA